MAPRTPSAATRPLAELLPALAEQHGAFYPAVDDSPPALELPLAERAGPVTAGPSALPILERRGVPVRLDRNRTDWMVAAALGGLLLLGAAAVAVRWSVRRRG